MPRPTSLRAALLGLLLPAAIHALRGAHPSNASRLSSGVTCILRDAPSAAPVALPAARINDDYCDCQDGADEPGTAACPGAVFWCRNAAFRPVSLPSSWVDDGNCDCCDGSDEPAGLCPDTCKEEAKKAFAAAKQQASAIREGVALRARYAKEAAKAADVDKLEIEKFERELKDMRVQLKKSENRADQLRKRKEHEEHMKRTAEKHSAPPASSPPSDQTEKDRDDPVAEAGNHAEEVGNDPGQNDDSLNNNNPDTNDQPEDAAPLDDNVKNNAESVKIDLDEDAPRDDLEVESDMDDDEDEYKDDQKDDEDDYEDDEDDHKDEEDDYKDDEDDYEDNFDRFDDDDNKCTECGEDETDEKDEDSNPEDLDVDLICAELSAGGPNRIMRAFNYLKVMVAAKLQRILPISLPAAVSPESIAECLRKANNAKFDIEDKKREIEEKLKKLKQKGGIYYGSDGALRKLHGSCVKKALGQYEFELCPFDLARQYEHGSSIAVLGRFKGWKEEGDTKVMNYAQGDRCWNGPPRSMKVELSCGKNEEIVSVEEPNRCAYRMKFKTPAVCESSAADALLADFSQESSEAKQEL